MDIQNWLQPGETLDSAVGRCVQMGMDDQVFKNLGKKHVLWSGAAAACTLVGACDDAQAVLTHITPDANLETALRDFGKKLKGDAKWYVTSQNPAGVNRCVDYLKNTRHVPAGNISIGNSKCWQLM